MEMDDFKKDSSLSGASDVCITIRSMPSNSGNQADSFSQAGDGSIIHDSFPSHSISMHDEFGRLSSG